MVQRSLFVVEHCLLLHANFNGNGSSSKRYSSSRVSTLIRCNTSFLIGSINARGAKVLQTKLINYKFKVDAKIHCLAIIQSQQQFSCARRLEQLTSGPSPYLFRKQFSGVS